MVEEEQKYKFDGKGKFVSLHAVKAYRGSSWLAPLILYLGTK
jgi:hypothetical protein